MWRHLVTKFPTNACDASWWPNFVLMQEFPTNSCGATCSWSPNSTCLHLDFYLLSWWWQPLWRGGLLYRWLLLQQKAYWIRFFFKISFLCIFCPWHSKKQGKKQIKTLKKNCFFKYFLIRSWANSSWTRFGRADSSWTWFGLISNFLILSLSL